MQLEPTGERLVVEHYKSSPEDYVIYLMHQVSYRFAEPLVRGKRVLDLGCGSGYGSAELAKVAAEVQAVDVAEDAVSYAREHYKRENLTYTRIAPEEPLPFADSAFDAVISFQVFEHVVDVHLYLSEVRRVLAPGGQLVLATPDRSTRLLPLQRPWNRWHVKEYGARELELRLRPFFGSVEVLRMSGRRDVIDIELRRYAKLKWFTLPVTLPVMPDAWRVSLLNLIHAVRGRPSKKAPPRDFDFDESAIHIGKGLAPSLNLVAVARR